MSTSPAVKSGLQDSPALRVPHAGNPTSHRQTAEPRERDAEQVRADFLSAAPDFLNPKKQTYICIQ